MAMQFALHIGLVLEVVNILVVGVAMATGGDRSKEEISRSDSAIGSSLTSSGL